MDIAGAFNNVHNERLIHNLRKRCIPATITNWVKSFLKGRNIQIQFNGAKSEIIPMPAGIPQGSPMSPMLYMYYNADLLDIPHQGTSLGFIDDVTYGVQGTTARGNASKLKNTLEKAEEWRKKHGAQFEPSKYVLIHFTHNHRQATNSKITINGNTIEPTTEAKYLGVIFDQKLQFKAHLQYITKKRTSVAMALSSIIKSNWGAQYKYAQQLFTAVIAARTDYGASIWHHPTSDGRTATTQIQKLTTIQRLAMKAITGCYKTTPTAAMEIEAELQPPRIRLQTKVLQVVTRMQCLSANHPLQEWFANALRVRTAAVTHRSNLENILQQYPLMTEKIETIEAFIRPLWWMPKINIEIGESKNKAKKQYREQKATEEPATIRLYTDGSSIENKIGAAVYNATSDTAVLQFLGPQFNIFVAEVTAINLALTMLLNCHIYTDSQAGAKAIDKPRRQSGQAIIKEVLDRADEVMENTLNLESKSYGSLDMQTSSATNERTVKREEPRSNRSRTVHSCIIH